MATAGQFGSLAEQYTALQMQVTVQQNAINKLTDGFTYSEGCIKDTLEARVASVVRELGTGIEESGVEIIDVLQLWPEGHNCILYVLHVEFPASAVN